MDLLKQRLGNVDNCKKEKHIYIYFEWIFVCGMVVPLWLQTLLRPLSDRGKGWVVVGWQGQRHSHW